MQVVGECRSLLTRTLAALYQAADLCAPYLDGRYNVDATDVFEGDAAEDVQAALEAGAGGDGAAADLGPEVTLLIAGALGHAVLHAVTTLLRRRRPQAAACSF